MRPGVAPRLPAVVPPAVIGVLAPASPVRIEYVEAGERNLERLGFRVRRSPHLFARADYTAGSPEQRVGDFLGFLDDPEVEAILCARGGYGCLDLLPRVPLSRLRAAPKAIIGASDATALLALASRAGIPSFHGPMLAQQIARGEAAWDSAEFLSLLAGAAPGTRLAWRGAETLHAGVAEGVLRGGCLSLVAALVGTPWAIRFAGAIAVLEDIGTKPFQIERMFTQLRYAGALDGVRGFVFGEMPGCVQHPDQGYTTADLLRRLTESFGAPAVFRYATGHTEPGSLCRTAPLEVGARMDEAGLTLLEGPGR